MILPVCLLLSCIDIDNTFLCEIEILVVSNAKVTYQHLISNEVQTNFSV